MSSSSLVKLNTILRRGAHHPAWGPAPRRSWGSGERVGERVREHDIRWLVALGRTQEAFTSAEAMASGTACQILPATPSNAS
jgi:hypothetical protein